MHLSMLATLLPFTGCVCRKFVAPSEEQNCLLVKNMKLAAHAAHVVSRALAAVATALSVQSHCCESCHVQTG